MTMTLLQELDQMHANYVDAVNSAVETGDTDLAEELGRSYDHEATILVAVRENKTDLLPLVRPIRKGGVPRRRAGWMRRAS